MASKTITYVAKNIEDLGNAPMVGVAVVRERRTNLFEVGTFLVDTGCLGVKDTMDLVIHDVAALEELKEDLFPDGYEEKSGAWGRKFVESAIVYARKLGFAPPRDYKKAAKVFGGTHAKDCDERFEFGKDGKPCYYQGPNESYQKAQKIISILTKRCGEDGFHYLVGGLSGEESADEEVDHCLHLLKEGELEEAGTKLNRLLAENPETVEVIFGMGLWHLYQNQAEQALPFLETATELAPDYCEAWVNRGMAHLRLSNSAEEHGGQLLSGGGNMRHLAEMLKCFQRALVSVSSDLDELDEGMAEGIAKCKDVVENFTREAEGCGIGIDDYIESMELYSVGLDLMDEEDWESALERFKAAADLNPRSHQSFGNMGTCLLQLGRVNEAREMLERAIEIEPNYAPVLSNLKIIEGCDDENPPKVQGFKMVDSSRPDE